MPVRSTMLHIIDETKFEIGQAVTAEAPVTSQQIQNVLDRHYVELDWKLLNNDVDFRRYTCTPRGESPGGASFDGWYPVGMIESDYQIRDTRSQESGTAFAPDGDVNMLNCTFNYTTEPDKHLYIFGRVYNIYFAAYDILKADRGSNGQRISQWRRLNVAETYDVQNKLKDLLRRGAQFNRSKAIVRRA